MKPRYILLYLAIKYKGNFDLILDALKRKEPVDEEEVINLEKNYTTPFLTLLDENYPEKLKAVFRPPIILFYYGDLSLLKDNYRHLAVVGSRKNTQYGKFATETLLKDLPKDVVIVSGMAKGIDSIAHRTAIESGHKTIAVLGSGIDVCYPINNKDIYNEMKNNHLIISEYPNGVEPSPNNFPRRNMIISGISQATLVTEAYPRSGTSITVNYTLEQGKDVLVVPYRIGENSECNRLISQGATIITSPNDIEINLPKNSLNN